MDLDNVKLPDGFHIQKTGGRPRKDAKFIAIAIAKFYKTEVEKTKAAKATEWIVAKWNLQDDAQVRSICRRMTKPLLAPLRNVLFAPWGAGGILAIHTKGGKSWFWHSDLMEVAQLHADAQATIEINADGHVKGGFSFPVEIISATPKTLESLAA